MALPTKEHVARAAGGNGSAAKHRAASLDDILVADDIRSEYVDVPEWGVTVRVRSLSGAERDKLINADTQDKGGPSFYARIIAASLIDDDGNNIGDQTSTPKRLMAKSAGALQRVWRVCARLSGIGDEALEAAKNDLKTTPSDDTGSD